MTFDSCIKQWSKRICAALMVLISFGCRGTVGDGPGANRPAQVQDFEVRFATRALLPNPGMRAQCKCDSTGQVHWSTRSQEVNLQLDPQQVQPLAQAAEAYVRQPAPFLKRQQRVMDGGLTEIYVRSGPTVRVSVIQNWRMAREGEALLDAIRRASAVAHPAQDQVKAIDDACEVLMMMICPDENPPFDWGGEPPVDVIPNDETAKLIELLKRDRPRWMDKDEAQYLLNLLSNTNPTNQEQIRRR